MKIIPLLFAVTLPIVIPVACYSQSFSADIVFLDANGHTASLNNNSEPKASRLFVSKEKMRLDMGGPDGTILLINAADETAFALFPAKKEYQALALNFSEYFRVHDPEDACRDWQKVSAQKIDCKKAGYEIVGGRQALKYLNDRRSDIGPSALWIDPELKFVIKWEGGGKGAELRNIHEEGQSADLFTLPLDYDVPKPAKGISKRFSHK
jgi:hypothetical protein